MTTHKCEDPVDENGLCADCTDKKYYESLEERIERLEAKLKNLETFQKQAARTIYNQIPIGGKRLR